MKHRNRLSHLVLLVLIITLLGQPAAVNSAALYRLTFINVGQGDAALLQDPNGFTVLIDGGTPEAGSTVAAFLRSRGVSQVDVMLASHPDSDHLGGLITVLQMTDIPVKSVIYNGYPGTTQTWTDFANAVAAEGLSLTAVTYPQTLTWGMMQAAVINPVSGLSSPETNAACLAVLVRIGSVKTLFACDLDSAQESVVMTRPLNLDADILKVAHHGSSGSSSAAFLNAVTPKDAVISVGSNSYGHPGADTLARLEDVGAQVWRTDVGGDITVLSDGVTYSVQPPSRVYMPVIMAPPKAVTPVRIVVTSVFYDGVVSGEPDEYVEIQNQGGAPVQLQGWTLSDAQSHVFPFPSYTMQPNQTCRVYTNQDHPEYCGFNYHSGSAIWNNAGDTAALKNSQGEVVSTYKYP